MKKLLFATMILILGCSAQQGELIILQGSIDSKVNGRLELTRNGDKIIGTFENTDDHTQLELRGTINGEFLRLEEFGEKDKLSGIFDGKYDGEEYSGDWVSPNRKRKVPFFFSNQGHTSPEAEPSHNRETDTAQRIAAEYRRWAKEMNRTEYCSPLECEKVLELGRNGGQIKESDCGMRLDEEIAREHILLGDINGDGKEDGIVTGGFIACMDGTWFVNVAMVGELVVFLSNGNEGYEILDEPKVIRDEIEMGRVIAIKDGIIYAEGGSISGESSMHDVDITWKSTFKYEKGKFMVVSSTEHTQRPIGE